jgi:tRNA(fMet)-specific endonuclease VapC
MTVFEMLILDTNHLVELDRGSAQGAALQRKLDDAGDEVATTIISAEEQFRGWLAQIHRQRDPHEQIATYQRLQRRIEFFAAWHVLPWDTDAANILQDLRRQRIRIGTMDLKIASIVLAHEATPLSGNLRDFQQVPNLRVEDWLS